MVMAIAKINFNAMAKIKTF